MRRKTVPKLINDQVLKATSFYTATQSPTNEVLQFETRNSTVFFKRKPFFPLTKFAFLNRATDVILVNSLISDFGYVPLTK